jgi:hypothetical protein
MPYPENIRAAINLTQKIARFAGNSIDHADKEFGEKWRRDFENLLSRLYSSPENLEAAIKGYRSFAIDSMRQQKKFEVEGFYPVKAFEKVSEEVYLNADYMTTQYLPGLLLSHYLWEHHYRQIEYFKTFVISALRSQKTANFLEVGVGTGIYSRIALEEIEELRGVGYEVSPLSMKFAEDHLKAYGLENRYSLELRDILLSPPEKCFQWVFVLKYLSIWKTQSLYYTHSKN